MHIKEVLSNTSHKNKESELSTSTSLNLQKSDCSISNYINTEVNTKIDMH